MKLYNFSSEAGKEITAFNSNFIISRILKTEQDSSIGCMYLEAGGLIGYHQAPSPQLLLILNGEGYVRGEENQWIRVHAGTAVFWQESEWHETRSESGLTAIVIESGQLNPASYMPVI